MAETQKKLDFSTRGAQLRTLADCVLPSVTVGARQTSGASLKAVLRGIDDCIGSKPTRDISIPQLCNQSGRSRAVVSAAIAALNGMSLIAMRENFNVVDGRAEQVPSTFRIVWSNVVDFVPTKPDLTSRVREPQRVSFDRPVNSPSPTEVGSLSLRLPPSQSETGVVSVWEGGSLSLRLPPSQTEALTAVPPVTAQLPPPPAANTGRRGRLWGWMDKTAFTKAVSRGDSDTIKRLCLEAVEAGALTDSDDSRRAFAAVCYDVRDCNSPVGVLAKRLASGEVRCDAVPESALKWADGVLGQTVTKERPTGVGQAGGCQRCIQFEIYSPDGCEVCNPAKRAGTPLRGAQRGETRDVPR